MKYKERGFIFLSVLGLMILIISVAMSVAVLNMNYSGDVVQDGVNKKLYYLANAGLELVYGALNNENSLTGTTELSVITQIQNDIDACKREGKPVEVDEDKYRMTEIDLPIKVENKVIGYAKVSAKLLKRDLYLPDGRAIVDYYYKILSTARKDDVESQNKPDELYTLTMMVFIESPNAPLIYSGDRDKPE